jgi:D-alanyl-lipoteichoic acid biosynthesis protein DltD
MKRLPHLAAALAALLATAAAVIAYTLYARYTENKYVHAVAALEHGEISRGIAIERVALRQSDLLLIYGASELVLLETEYEATRFFSTYPTGFMVFNAATKGGSSLTVAQRLAALGPELRGRRVIFAIGPAIMTMAPFGDVAVRHYEANFSELHAFALAFNPRLSLETKRLAAQRMLNFPETLAGNPFLLFTMRRLADPSPPGTAMHFLSYPIGALQIAILQLQDHYATVEYIHHLSAAQVAVSREPRAIDWQALIAVAEAEQIENSDSNPYGVDNSQWPKIKELFLAPAEPGSRDADFINDVTIAREWDDLRLALRVIREAGADALIMSSPMNVPLWEVIGVSEHAQNAYYDLLHSVVDPFEVPVLDGREWGRIPYFSMDLASHASRKGWIYVDQRLDDIYHRRLP